MKKENKKKVLIFSIMGVLLIGIAISFAYWQIVFEQDNPNVVTTDCFKVTFTDGDAIYIPDAYPVSDIEGMKYDSYDFTVTNICNNRVLYQINLESLIPEEKRLPERYIKVNLMEESISKVTTKLEEDLKVEPTIEGADNAYKLLEGEIGANSSKTFHLRLWMHSEVTSHDEESMNATYVGKVSVITSYTKPLQTVADTIKSIPVVTSGNGLYEITHEDAEITYTTNTEEQNMLKQTELRYAGSNPNNYVKFNNELWRVIGLVNTPEGQRIKIIRNESIGDYAWDTSEASVNEAAGVNEWSQADMMNFLNNGEYYNNELTDEAKEMIDTITWNTGSNSVTEFETDEELMKSSTIPKRFYNLERSNNTGKQCNGGNYCTDQITRTTTWSGKVGLMYASDYGYATSGGSTTNKQTCESISLLTWSESSDCYSNNWLYNEHEYRWTITPRATSSSARRVFCMIPGGNINTGHANTLRSIFPSVYLRTNIKISDGNGTMTTPYELSA